LVSQNTHYTISNINILLAILVVSYSFISKCRYSYALVTKEPRNSVEYKNNIPKILYIAGSVVTNT